jgi:Big-like domain-containing protein
MNGLKGTRRVRLASLLAAAGTMAGVVGATLAAPTAVAADYSTDLAVTVTETADPTLVGNQFAYTISVTNKGGTVSPPVTLEMAYSRNMLGTTNDNYCRLQIADASTPEWAGGDGLYYQCYIGDVAPASTLSWQVREDTSAPRQLSIDVIAKPYLPSWIGNPTPLPYVEQNPADNRAQASTVVSTVPTSLKLTQVLGPSALFGKPVTYQVTLSDASESHQWLCTPQTVQLSIDGVSTQLTNSWWTGSCGAFSYKTSSLAIGKHQVQAAFAGSGPYLPSQSGVYTTVVR